MTRWSASAPSRDRWWLAATLATLGDPAAQWGRADVLHYEAMRGGGAQRLGGMGGD